MIQQGHHCEGNLSVHQQTVSHCLEHVTLPIVRYKYTMMAYKFPSLYKGHTFAVTLETVCMTRASTMTSQLFLAHDGTRLPDPAPTVSYSATQSAREM